MKKRLVTAAVSSMLMTAILSGCAGSADKTQGDSSLFEQVSETSTEQPAGGQEEKKAEESKPAEVQQGSSLYEDFKAGTTKAKYTGAGDMTSYLETATCLEKGNSYTMNEIISALESGADCKMSSDPVYTMIDCGSDGVQELLVVTGFDPEYTLYMIIKDIDGELTICFDQDAWSRSDVQVHEDGTIDSSGSAGAAVHIWDQAFVDAAGEYHFYYGCEETLTLYGDFYLDDKADHQVMSTEGLDVDHIGIRDYYFEPNYEERTHYYEYFMIDDNFDDVTTEADYDDSNQVKLRFKECGVETYTAAQIEELLNSRAAEIGYKK